MSEALIILITFAVDQITKIWIEKTYMPGQSTKVIENFFYIHYLQNDGAAWSMLRGKQVLLSLIAFVAIFVMLKYMLGEKKKGTKVVPWCLAFMIGGAAGNLLDRLVFGYVRDFLDFFIFGYDFPVFNVADMALSVGVIVLILALMKQDETGAKA